MAQVIPSPEEDVMAVIAGAALMGGLSAGMNALSQRNAIKEASKYNKMMRNAEVLNATYANSARSFEHTQTQDQFQQQKLAVQMRKLQAQGTARARGGASGLTGRGIQQLSQRFSEDAARAMSVLTDNSRNANAAYGMDRKASQQALTSRIQSQAKLPKFSWTSLVSSGINGAAQGASLGSNLKIGANNGAGSPGVKT